MKPHIEIETLEALARETLEADQAEEASAHATTCEDCQRELAWLRAEHELMARRSRSKLSVNTWPHVVVGIDANESRQRMRRWFAFGGSALLAVACVMLLLAGGRQEPQVASPFDASAEERAPIDDKDPQLVLAQAEHEYDVALDTLAVEYQKNRQQLGASLPPEFDEQLRAVRKDLAKARRDAGNNMGARVAVLDSYSGYLHSVQDTVFGMEEGLR